ncbi:response regulator [Halorientalis litorea]|jgi:two-component system chemotaxis response regulator CheY|uniref:response regulator n=1 Tax=Halorientalis litorea TaxID=2931977 RepID=UPI001FF2D048|nr:response regulator [Halorientalis litorea]
MSLGVLIVDDSGYMRANVASALDISGFEIVAEAENGAKAVQQFKNNRDKIDLVMMDIVMRKANGVKATAALNELDDDIKVIMCTSVGQKKKMKLAAKAGADGYLIKPFSDRDVKEAIRNVFEEDALPKQIR